MSRRGQRQQVAGQVAHLLGHLQARHALAHQGLVHVDVEEAHLGVGDLGHGLAVDAAELQEGDEREAGIEHRGHVAERLDVLLGLVLDRGRREADAGPEAPDQLGLEPGGVRGVAEPARLLAVREELLHEAVRQAPLARCLADLLEGVAALPQAGDDAGVRGRGRGPVAGAVDLGDHARLGPALQGCRRDPGLLGRLLQRELVACHAADGTAAEPTTWLRH